ncbi:hypothetical protein EBR03_01300 [bacterium]|nr:hypothetical protein [bacterium]NBW98185.1 hypothetical protein [bacterium]NBX82168.1 hypothetical protein [bacterium]
MLKNIILTLLALFCLSSLAADIPGGMNRSAEVLPSNSYEMLLSPGFTLEPSGAYLSSEVRYQANEEVAAGLAFGAGEVGFNFGLAGTWYVLGDDGSQPALSVSGGLHFNRLLENNYFAVRISPTVSKNLPATWGRITPYAAAHLTPNFRLGAPENNLALKASIGTEFLVKPWGDMRLVAEAGVGVSNSVSEFMLAVAYPFVAL